MVVPVEKLTSEKSRKFIGNNLKLNIVQNRRTLIITGNNCKVKLNENNGAVKVVGDSCELCILRGNGSVEYVGNNGKIRLGNNISEEVVTYIGNEGEITVYDGSSYEDMKSHGKGVRVGDVNTPRENIVNICNSNKVRCSRPVMTTDRLGYIPIVAINKNVTLGRHLKL